MPEIYCLNCHKSIREEGTFLEMFYVDDVLCKTCRSKMTRYVKTINLDGLQVEGLYLYSDLVRDLIIQYKEYKDEALFPLFLWKDIKRLKKKYKDYVIVCLPSSQQASHQRGFDHVKLMFEMLDLEMVDVLYKSQDIFQKQMKLSQRKDIGKYLRIKDEWRIEGKKVLLVDDIITSGETIKAADKLVSQYAKEVKGLVISYNTRYLNQFEKIFIRTLLTAD